MEENVLFAFLLTVFAGLSTGIGSFIGLLSKKFNPKVLTISLGFSAGVMIYVSNGYTGNAVYAFSDGSTWKQVITGTDITSS